MPFVIPESAEVAVVINGHVHGVYAEELIALRCDESHSVVERRDLTSPKVRCSILAGQFRIEYDEVFAVLVSREQIRPDLKLVLEWGDRLSHQSFVKNGVDQIVHEAVTGQCSHRVLDESLIHVRDLDFTERLESINVDLLQLLDNVRVLDQVLRSNPSNHHL